MNTMEILTLELSDLRHFAFGKGKPAFDGGSGVFSSARIKQDLVRLRDVLTASGDIGAFFRVVDGFALLGRMQGDHPLISSAKNNLRTKNGRVAISAKVERRLKIVTPLILAEAKINPKAVAKRTFKEANELLMTYGEKCVGERTYAELVSATTKPTE